MSIKPKKWLGQNFLFDKNIQRKLIAAYGLNASDEVLEIGAGYGELTRHLARHVDFVYALEFDPELCNALRENTSGYENIAIINQDILRFNLKSRFGKLRNKIKVVGNIPYYITTPIIQHLLKYRVQIEVIFLTVQKEFAKRIIAGPGSKEYGSFSCFVQYYAIPEILFFIKKSSFTPVPKVDSSLLKLNIRSKPKVPVKKEILFFKIVRAAFNKRRKTLRNSLDGIVPEEKLRDFFNKYSLDPNIRPEDLSLEDFARLSNL